MGSGRRDALQGARLDQRERARVLTPAEAAWIAVVPCALLVIAAIVLLGPPLGRAFFAPPSETIFPGVEVHPEPTEHARYGLALLGPLLLAGAIATVARRGVRLSKGTIRLLVRAGQLATAAFVAYCLLAQYTGMAAAVREPWSPATRFFQPPTLVVAAAFTLLLLGVLRTPGALERIVRLTRETPARRIACTTLAVLYAADWMMRAINFDSTIAYGPVLNLIPWEMSESFAVVNGRSPLVDFHAMYGHLWSYVVGGTMSVAGASVGTWTTAMATISCLALLAVFAVLRRVTRSSPLALALFVPFVAISLWVVGPPSTGTSIASVFSMWPLRYGGPYLLACLVARHVDGAAPRQPVLLFVVAGLVLVNNLEFGLAGYTATVVAIVLAAASAGRPVRAQARVLGEAAIGLAGALSLISLLTLTRTGELPHLDLLFEFPRLFGTLGWGLEPMPAIGLQVAMYSTFVGAIGVAVARATRREDVPVLTSMLGWSGTFGLLAASYYVGRSDPGNLIPLFSTWSFCLALLIVAVVRHLALRPRLPILPEVAVVFAFGLALGSLPNVPTPWSQVERLRREAPEAIFQQRDATAFVASRTRPAERVAILAPLGFRIAHDLGLVNVSPYVSLEAMRTPAQIDNALDAVRSHQVHRVFMKTAVIGEESGNLPAVQMAFEQAGFVLRDQEARLLEYTDVGAAG